MRRLPTLNTGRLTLRAFLLSDSAVVQHRAGLGYRIGGPYWGRSYATEAARTVIARRFRKVSLQRIDAHHMVRNPASGRVMARAGMQHEGTLRRHLYRWGVPEDIAMWGILADPGA